MNKDVLNNTKNRILSIDKEIKKLEQQREKILKYYEYFESKKDEYSLLTSVPSNPDDKPQFLYDYSILNVDVIGRIICKLVKKYDNKDYVFRRLTTTTRTETFLETYWEDDPILVIGQKDEVESLYHNSNNIIIPYDGKDLDKYPTKKPVTWTPKYGRSYESSNYSHLLNMWDGLAFECPRDKEYIMELIYSLAYYQEQHDKKYMTDEETMNVYKRIYKNS